MTVFFFYIYSCKLQLIQHNNYTTVAVNYYFYKFKNELKFLSWTNILS